MRGKKILLGITGSIAAYKAAILVRLLIKQGAQVQVMMTVAAADFISPLTLQTLSQHPVHTAVSTDAGWNNHVEMGLWADAMVVAPCTANTLAKLANGICDNLLTATYLSARCPVFVAPAMDLDMWQHQSTRRNLKFLEENGTKLIPVGFGELASGLVGAGRMAEPEEIVLALENYFNEKEKKDFAGKKVLITSGATREPIDPVRFISNHSTGQMGAALADTFAQRGAQVHYVCGVASHSPKEKNILQINVNTAAEMFDAAKQQHADADIVIFAAAVADYTPAEPSLHKIKKNTESVNLTLTKTQDIAALLGSMKSEKQLHVGFALETDNELANAKIKLEKKKFDFIVLNSLRDAGAGFGYDTNKVTILDVRGNEIVLPLLKKIEVAEKIADMVADFLK